MVGLEKGVRQSPLVVIHLVVVRGLPLLYGEGPRDHQRRHLPSIGRQMLWPKALRAEGHRDVRPGAPCVWERCRFHGSRPGTGSKPTSHSEGDWPVGYRNLRSHRAGLSPGRLDLFQGRVGAAEDAPARAQWETLPWVLGGRDPGAASRGGASRAFPEAGPWV
jgi:hypothetical protein